MKKLLIIPFLFLILVVIKGQPVIIDHNCIDLSQIPDNWIDSAKLNLYIGYGHTSHGSQISSGMNALESYFTDGKYDWSHEGGEGELHLFEGSEYEEGYLELDVGYDGWEEETKTFLTDFPACNVIMWSWCGQVNDVNLQSHYLDSMQQLETDYPNVKFVYMTGHLEGLGSDGSLHQANQQIRNFCINNNKILFDFADIEKYAPYSDVNLQNFYANDECDYDPDGAEPIDRSQNWAENWLTDNPTNELTLISAECGDCAHSVSLNCVKKGIASWYLWTRLVGWEGDYTAINDNEQVKNVSICPNPAGENFTIFLSGETSNAVVHIFDLQGKSVYQNEVDNTNGEITITDLSIPAGMYILQVADGTDLYKMKLVKY